MSVALLPLCSIPKVASKDGYTGQNAKIFLPFYGASAGYHFFSGQVFTFPGSIIAQDPSLTDVGTAKPNTFTKDGVVCSS